MCGFVTPLQGPEADEHRKPEVAETTGPTTCRLTKPGPSCPSLLMLSGRGWPRGRLGEGWGQCHPSH